MCIRNFDESKMPMACICWSKELLYFNMYIYIHLCKQKCVYTFPYVHTHVYIYTNVNTYKYMSRIPYSQIYIYIYIHNSLFRSAAPSEQLLTAVLIALSGNIGPKSGRGSFCSRPSYFPRNHDLVGSFHLENIVVHSSSLFFRGEQKT